MPARARKNLSLQLSPEVRSALRGIAESEGRPMQAVLDEALRDYIEWKTQGRPRRKVMEAFAGSVGEFDELYRSLADLPERRDPASTTPASSVAEPEDGMEAFRRLLRRNGGVPPREGDERP